MSAAANGKGAKGRKTFFAPLPMRALCDQDLSALDLRVLACIAYHDRLSLSRETGQGCVASHETLSDEVGCHYTNLSSAISKLKKLGYVQHAKSPDDGRRHVYRVPYDHEDSLSFGKRSAAARDARKTGADAAGGGEIVGHSANDAAEIVCPGQSKTRGNSSTSPSQYISLNDGINLAEATERDSIEMARLQRACSAEGEDLPVNAHLARFEREFNKGARNGATLDLLGWARWLDGVAWELAGEQEGHWAARLIDRIEDVISEADYAKLQAQREAAVSQVVHLVEPAADPEPVDALRSAIVDRWHQLSPQKRRAVASQTGITPDELQGFVQGSAFIDFRKQLALRSAMAAAA